MICEACRGEGRRNQPPYDPKRPQLPVLFRHPSPCPVCAGDGVLPATDAQIAQHTAGAAADYSGARVYLPS